MALLRPQDDPAELRAVTQGAGGQLETSATSGGGKPSCGHQAPLSLCHPLGEGRPDLFVAPEGQCGWTAHRAWSPGVLSPRFWPVYGSAEWAETGTQRGSACPLPRDKRIRVPHGESPLTDCPAWLTQRELWGEVTRATTRTGRTKCRAWPSATTGRSSCSPGRESKGQGRGRGEGLGQGTAEGHLVVGRQRDTWLSVLSCHHTEGWSGKWHCEEGAPPPRVPFDLHCPGIWFPWRREGARGGGCEGQGLALVRRPPITQ